MFQRVARAFTEHPKDIGENYFQHLAFTLRMTLRFIAVSIIMMIHGLLPFLFQRTGSEQIQKIYERMKTRTPADESGDHYYI